MDGTKILGWALNPQPPSVSSLPQELNWALLSNAPLWGFTLENYTHGSVEQRGFCQGFGGLNFATHLRNIECRVTNQMPKGAPAVLMFRCLVWVLSAFRV